MKKTRSLLAVLICLALLVSLCAVTASAADTVSSKADFTALTEASAAGDSTKAVMEGMGLTVPADSNPWEILSCHAMVLTPAGGYAPCSYIQVLEAGEGKVFAEDVKLRILYAMSKDGIVDANGNVIVDENGDPVHGSVVVSISADGQTWTEAIADRTGKGTEGELDTISDVTVPLANTAGLSKVYVKFTLERKSGPTGAMIGTTELSATVEEPLPENAVQAVADFTKLSQFAGGSMPNEQDAEACAAAFAAAKAAMEDLGLTVPEDSGPWVLQDCYHVFATPINGYRPCSVIQTLDAGEGKVLEADAVLTMKYWMAKVSDPSYIIVQISTDGENWAEAWANREGLDGEGPDACTEQNITLEGTAGVSKLYVKIIVERHGGQTAGGLSALTLTGLTKDAPKVEETTPTVPETTPTVPETTPTVPETTPTVPETTPTVPETTPTVPETTPTVPETTPTVPETTPTVPETTPTVPATDPTPTEPAVSKPVNSVVDFEALSEFAAIDNPAKGDIAATKAKMEEMGLIIPDRIGWFENADEDANHAWVLQSCFNVFLTPRDGYQNCAYIQVMDAGEGNVLKDDAVLTLKYWLAKVNDPSYIVVEVSTDGENWEEAWANEEGFGAEYTADACTEENITLEGTAGATKVYVKIIVNRHSGQTAGGVVKSAISGMTKGASDVEETTPATEGGQTPPETGDAINVVIAMLAVSGMAITVLKKKEN